MAHGPDRPQRLEKGERLIKYGAKVIAHSRNTVFDMAGAAAGLMRRVQENIAGKKKTSWDEHGRDVPDWEKVKPTGFPEVVFDGKLSSGACKNFKTVKAGPPGMRAFENRVSPGNVACMTRTEYAGLRA